LVNEAGRELLLDERVRCSGSHHQTFVMIERDGRPEVAFVGGIDFCTDAEIPGPTRRTLSASVSTRSTGSGSDGI
jgi:hypothetical protein